ncbi:MAG: DMT family transporter [Ruminococcus sp.]|nr:DMT family transporter [Ruminococcus sp.]
MTNAKYKGVILIVISAFCFALMSLFVRLSGDLPTFQKVFFRNFVALFIAAGTLVKNKTRFIVKGKTNNLVLLVRATAGTLGMVGNFYAIDRLVMSDASMLNKMSPFFVIIFSVIFLKERLNSVQGFAVIAAFVGSLFIIKPTLHIDDVLPAVAGFLGGLGAGLAYTCVRYLGQHGVDKAVIVAYFSGFSCVFSLPFMLASFHHMELWQLLCLLGAGTAAAGGQFTITAAYSYAPAREISVYDYSQLIFTTVLGYFVFSDTPDKWSFLGYFIIVSVSVGMFIYNNRDRSSPEVR